MRMLVLCRERDFLINYLLEKELYCNVDKWKSIDFWKYYFILILRFNNILKYEY